MNATRRLKKRRVDITVDRSAILNNLFYGYEAPASSKGQKVLDGAKRLLMGAGRIVAFPFIWIGKAALYFAVPVNPKRTKDQENLMAESKVPYYRPNIGNTGKMAAVKPDAYAPTTVAAPKAKTKAQRKRRVKRQRPQVLVMERPESQVSVVDVPIEEVLPFIAADAVKEEPIVEAAVVMEAPVDAPVAERMDAPTFEAAAGAVAMDAAADVLTDAVDLAPDAVALPRKRAHRRTREEAKGRSKAKAQSKAAAGGGGGWGKKTAIGLLLCGIIGGIGFGGWYWMEGRFCNVTVFNDAEVIELRTAEKKVGDVLKENDLSLNYRDRIDCGTEAAVYEGMEIRITRAKDVVIRAGGEDVPVKMPEGTVKDALIYASISYDDDDEISPSLDTPIEPGMTIQVVGVEVKTVTKTETVDYEIIYKNSSSLKKGTTKVSQKGKEGVRTIVTKVTYKDGKEVSTEEVSNEITTKPVNKIVLRGTKVVSTSGNYQTGYTKPTEDMIARKVTLSRVTAYTHTGHRTATGKWPKVGMCAVDPKMFPYGTKLFVPGYGYAVAEDTGGFVKWEGTQIDLFMNTEAECRRWGVKRNLTVYVIKK
ncbi:MAG: DUF348 domain-containing protein [Clostridiales bacterium]|nr:DUF348 domain-containing protein [Clostridiales bacterium]